jgi:hypothetical protein
MILYRTIFIQLVLKYRSMFLMEDELIITIHNNNHNLFRASNRAGGYC